MIRTALILVICFWFTSFGQPINNQSGDCPNFEYRLVMDDYPAPAWPSNFGDNYQLPLEAEESINCIEVANDLMVELWASEDMFGGVLKAYTMTWDEKGRAWLAETFDYPNDVVDINNSYGGNDRIRILEDTDGDRIADKSTIFVEGLNMPSSVTFTTEGVLVTVAPNIILFRDEDGDDVADDPQGEILLTGFNKYDTHGGPSNLQYGLDNWIWGCTGYNGGTGGTGLWRMQQDGSSIEQWGGTSNTWSLGYMEDGQVFNTHATGGGHSRHWTGPNDFRNIFDDGTPEYPHGDRAYPITDDHDCWECGNYTSTANHQFYLSRYLPMRYWGLASFVCDNVYHVCHVDFMEPNGATWTATQDPEEINFIASTDAWFSAVDATTGPDGAVWVMDWYNFLALHNPAQPLGSGGAYDHPIRDKKRTRIYRVVRNDGLPLEAVYDLTQATPLQLVGMLKNPNMRWRLHAQRLLLKDYQENGANTEVINELMNITANRRCPDIIDVDGPVVHATRILDQMGQFPGGNPVLQKKGQFAAEPEKWDRIMQNLATHPSSGVRRNLAQILPTTVSGAEILANSGLLNDADPQVRLAAVQAAASMPAVPNMIISPANANSDDILPEYVLRAQNVLAVGEPIAPPLAYAKRAAIQQENCDIPDIDVSDLVIIPGLTMDIKGTGYKTNDYALHFRKNSDGVLQVRLSVGVPAGVFKVFTPQGKLVAQREFDGNQLKGSPLVLQQQLHYYTLENGSSKHKYKGLIGNLTH
jgi:putative membrane-bound dehydrogenase-like protein